MTTSSLLLLQGAAWPLTQVTDLLPLPVGCDEPPHHRRNAHQGHVVSNVLQRLKLVQVLSFQLMQKDSTLMQCWQDTFFTDTLKDDLGQFTCISCHRGRDWRLFVFSLAYTPTRFDQNNFWGYLMGLCCCCCCCCLKHVWS